MVNRLYDVTFAPKKQGENVPIFSHILSILERETPVNGEESNNT